MARSGCRASRAASAAAISRPGSVGIVRRAVSASGSASGESSARSGTIRSSHSPGVRGPGSGCCGCPSRPGRTLCFAARRAGSLPSIPWCRSPRRARDESGPPGVGEPAVTRPLQPCPSVARAHDPLVKRPGAARDLPRRAGCSRCCIDGPKGEGPRIRRWSRRWCQRLEVSASRLLVATLRMQAWPMFLISDSDAATIRAAMEHSGELGAAVELLRLFPGAGDLAQARQCARTIAGWRPVPVASEMATPLTRRQRPRSAPPT